MPEIEAFRDIEHPERIKAELDKYDHLIAEMTEKGYHKDAAELRRANKKMREFYDFIGLGPELRKLEIEEQQKNHSSKSTAASRFVNRQLSEERALIETGEKLQQAHQKMVECSPFFIAGILTVFIIYMGRIFDPISWCILTGMWALCGILYLLLKAYFKN